MFDQTPIRERTVAVGVFAAIGLCGLGAMYLLFTGGFATIAPYNVEAAAAEAPAYVRVVQSDWAPPAPGGVTRTSYVIGEVAAGDYPTEDLEGDANAQVRDRTAERSYEDIERDIEALYEGTAQYREEEPRYEEASYQAEGDPKDETTSDDENASPW
jgi:hypothetical protein